MMTTITHIIGGLALLTFIISYQEKNNRRLFYWHVVGCGLLALQMLLLGAYTGCISNAFTIVRNVLLSRYNEWKWARWKGWVVIFSLLFVGTTAMTWIGPLSLLPLLSSVANTIVYWQNNAGRNRLVNLCVASPSWIIYDVLVGSWGGAGSELCTMASALVSIYRFGWKNLMAKDSSFSK